MSQFVRIFLYRTLVHGYEQDKAANTLNNWQLTTQKVQSFSFGAVQAVRNTSLCNIRYDEHS